MSGWHSCMSRNAASAPDSHAGVHVVVGARRRADPSAPAARCSRARRRRRTARPRRRRSPRSRRASRTSPATDDRVTARARRSRRPCARRSSASRSRMATAAPALASAERDAAADALPAAGDERRPCRRALHMRRRLRRDRHRFPAASASGARRRAGRPTWRTRRRRSGRAPRASARSRRRWGCSASTSKP